jgi:hypothetical protein
MPPRIPPYSGPTGPFGEDFNTAVPSFSTDIFTFVKAVSFGHKVPPPLFFSATFTFQTLEGLAHPGRMAMYFQDPVSGAYTASHTGLPGSVSLARVPMPEAGIVVQAPDATVAFNMEGAGAADNLPLSFPFRGAMPYLGGTSQYFSERALDWVDVIWLYRWRMTGVTQLQGTPKNPGKILHLSSGWTYGIQAINDPIANGYKLSADMATTLVPPQGQVSAGVFGLFKGFNDDLLAL